MKGIGNQGAAFISRIEAKEALELVAQRIQDTVRTRKKEKEKWFDRDRGMSSGKAEDSLGREKQGMQNFLKRVGIGGTESTRGSSAGPSSNVGSIAISGASSNSSSRL